MKKVKSWVLILSMAVPGLFTYSCSGTLATKVRDALLAGASGAVTEATWIWVDEFIPEPEAEATE